MRGEALSDTLYDRNGKTAQSEETIYDEVDELLEERERFWPDADPCWSAIGARIIRIARYLDEDRATRLEQFGVTSVEFDMLMVLRHFGGDEAAMRPSQIADKLLLSRTRTTVRVDGLVDRHLVDRFGDPSNRRQVVVQLSPLGHDLLDRAFGAYQGGLRELLSPMPKASHDELVNLLRGVLEGVQERAHLNGVRCEATAY